MVRKAHALISLSQCAFLICACNKKQNEHNLILRGEISPSFYEDGYLAHYECKDCGKVFDLRKEEVSIENLVLKLPLFNTLNQSEPMTLFGMNLQLDYDAQAFNQLVDDSNALITRIDGKRSYTATEANEIIKRINEMLSVVYKQYDISYILADASGKAEDYNKKNEIYKAYYDLQDQYYAVYVALAKEGSYNHLFFKDKSQDYINQYIEDHSPKEGSGGSVTITTAQKIEMLLNDYKAGKIERYPAYHDYVALAKQLATEKSYSSYLDYAYVQNNREYSVAQAMDLCDYVTTYLTPLKTSLNNKLSEFDQNAEVKNAYKGLSNNFFGKNIDLLREYSLNLGSPYKDNFQSFFEGGHYFFSNVNNPNVTGYTAVNASLGRLIFLSRNYQDLMTLTHEFGHYNAGEVFGGVSSLDLSETQSNGNELLLLSFMKNSNLIDPSVAEAFVCDQLSKHINDVLLGCSVNELENFVYTSEFDQTTLENKWEEILTKYGADVSRNHQDYMYQVLLNYRGYYISYAVSGIAALQLYAKAVQDFTAAKNSYKSIFTKDSQNEKFKLSLENAGLIDIFEEDAYKTITEALS